MKSFDDIPNEDSNTVVIIDAMNLFHRQFHKFQSYPKGTAYGFVNSMIGFRNRLNTNRFIVCWEGDNIWRKEQSSDYKKERSADRFTDEDSESFFKSLQYTKELLGHIGIIQVMKDDLEADDLIAYYALKYKTNVVIISNDKDFMQLISDKRNVSMLRPDKKHGYIMCHEADVVKIYGVVAKDIPKLLAIAGDSSDGVKGVYKFGPVKAIKLINDGMIYTDNLKNVFNKEQLRQFIDSYKLVKLGIERFHHIDVTKKDIANNNHENESASVYLSRIQKVLDSFEIKKYTAVEIKTLYNSQFVKSFKAVLK